MKKATVSSTVRSRISLRVLIVEDRENDLLLLLDQLDRAGYDVTHVRVETLPALRQELTGGHSWDVVISDFSLPTMTAHDVLGVVTALRPELPCIVVSGTITEEAAVDVLRAGARDFVVKERMTRLVPALERELRESAERRRLMTRERALLEGRERMQLALEAVGVGTWESELDGGRTIWSEVLGELHGLPPGGFAGTFDGFVQLIHPDDRSTVLAEIARAQREHTDSRIEYRVIRPDGAIRWLLGIGRTLCDSEGRPVRATGVGLDITAQKFLEEQFRQAQKMESIGNLAGGIAHDFNNLLTVILGCCELAAERRAEADTELSDSLEAIRTAATSATVLTRQLLTFARREIQTPRLVNLNDAIHEFEKILRRLVEENVVIEYRLAPALDLVRVDPSQIEQVLLNLVANARDAMPGGGTVIIQTRALTVADGDAATPVPAGDYVRLSVSDTGPGIQPEARARLFEPFFTTKPVGRGTGLGLSTVHAIMKQSGGYVSVDSDPAAGATFHMYLPVARRADEGPADQPAAPGTNLQGSETILVVEDNAALRRMVDRMLRRFGYHVLLASGGPQAEQLCKANAGRIAVLLTDVVMPGSSGPEVAETVLRCSPDAKVIYMSGYAANHDDVTRTGDGFVQKPFTALQLGHAIRGLLTRQP